MTITRFRNNAYIGLSSDTKPTTVPASSTFLETDTGINWIYNGTTWVDLFKSGTEIYTNKTMDMDLNTMIHQNMDYDYVVYPVGSIYKAKNTKTGVVDYTDSNPFIDPILNNIISANTSTGISLKLSPDTFIFNNVVTIPSNASGSPIFRINGTLGSRSGRATVIQAANNSGNLSGHSFFEGLGGTVGTAIGPSCDIGFMTLYNPFFTTFSMGGIAMESDISNATYASMYLHDLTLYYAAGGKGGLWVKGQGFLRVNNVFSIDSNPAYVGTIDFCFVGGITDATGGNLANDHADGILHAQITNIHASHSGTGAQGAGGSMQHSLWVGLKYGKLSHLNFDGWAFRDNPIVFKDAISCVVSDLHHQDMNVVDSGNVGDCGILLYSQDTGGVSTCWGNRLQNMRIAGWPSTGNKVFVKCQGASNIGPQNNYIELEEYGNNKIRINEVNGAYNVFYLKPGSHTMSSFTQTAPQIDSIQTTSSLIDMRGGNLNFQPLTLQGTGRITGTRMGFTSGEVNATCGTNLLNNIVAGNGTGATNAAGTDTTDGARCNNATGTNNTFARAGYWSGGPVARKYNPQFTIRFRLGAAQTSSNAILYIGLVNQSAQPAAGVSMLSTYLDSKIGVLFGFRAADTTWMIMSNNNQATSVYTSLTGLPNSGATDAVAHTLSIRLSDAVPNITWSFDGVLQTAITDTTNSVPPSTTILYPIAMLEAQSATSLSFFERWSQVSMDIP